MMKGKGYDALHGNNKKYSFNKSLRNYKKTGFFRTRIDAKGHDAGFNWAKVAEIDPYERKRKYGLNSPSFDEGVYSYKQRIKESTRSKALKAKIRK